MSSESDKNRKQLLAAHEQYNCIISISSAQRKQDAINGNIIPKRNLNFQISSLISIFKFPNFKLNFFNILAVRNNSGGGPLLRVSRPSSLPEEGTTRIDVDQAYPAHRDVSESSSGGGGRRSYPTSMLTTLSHTPTVSSKVRKQLQQQQQQLGASGPKIRVDAGMGSNSSNCSSSSGFSSGTATNGSSNNSCRVVSVLQTSGSDDSDGTSGKAVVTTRAVIRINGGNDPPAAAMGRNDLCSHIRQVPSEVNNVVVDGGGTESSEDCSSGPPGGFRGWPGGSLQRPSCSSSSSASSSSFDNPSSTFSSRSRTLVASEGQGQQLHRDDELGKFDNR